MMQGGTPVRFGVLGPVEAWIADRRAELGHAKQKSVLAVLLADAARVFRWISSSTVCGEVTRRAAS